MFDIEAFLSECVAARAETEPRRAIKAVLDRAMRRPREIAEALRPERATITKLLVSPELTVLNAVWAPGMSFRPHDHRMWAAIGIYAGGEVNTFYRRGAGGLVPSGGKELRVGDAAVLGDDTVHGVANPTPRHAGAIHIYGGDLLATPRSEWDEETFEERPYDVDAALRYFAEYEDRPAEAG